MKAQLKNIIVIALGLLIAIGSLQSQDLATEACDWTNASAPYSKAGEIEQILSELLEAGIPGVAVSIHSEEGWYHHAAGFAKIEEQVPMQSCHLHYIQSIAKTYMGVIIMKLLDEDRIELDKPMSFYMPELKEYVERADQVTIRMLLNHTSGVPEYNADPYYLTQLLQNPTKDWTPYGYLEIIKGKPLMWEPGSRYWYCNMNYEILALIADKITGDHAQYLDDEILKPLGITETYYRNHESYLDYPNLINGYWDRYSNGILENVSVWERQNVSDMIGDDGIVSTPQDAIKFLKGLMEGKILSDESLALMQEWVKDKKGTDRYGLGLDVGDFNHNTGVGHSGGGLAAGNQLYYFPEKKICFFIGINLGTITESPIHGVALPLVERLHSAILN